MPVRGLPVRPDLDQLRRQAKELLSAIHANDPSALADLHEFHPSPPDAASAKLADAQLVIARSYQAELASPRPGVRSRRCDLAR